MNNTQENNKRLAQNTIILYIRMFLTVGVSLYITRVVLHNLGVHQFGLYNLIGGFVSMFYIVTASLSGAITRFITYELGKNRINKLIQVFSTSINIQILFSAIVLLLGETGGLWFINFHLNIKSEQIWIANIVYQLSLFSFIIELLGVPFYSLVVAHEKMKLFAFNAILTVLLKLLLALLLTYALIDKIIFYAIGMLVVGIISQLVYVLYSRKKFIECRYKYSFEKDIFLQMFSFGGWNLLTSITLMLRSQGLNVLLNIFWGTAINAAFSVARQIEGTIRAFSKNFLIAINPQITKSYAEGDIHRTQALVYKGTKYSFLLLYIFGLPFILLSDIFLEIWLTDVPPFTSTFVQLIIILSLVEILLTPTEYLNQATGDIKRYKIITSLAQITILPIGYILLKLNFNPYTTMYAAIAAELLTFPYRIQLNKKLAGITWTDYCKQVLVKLLPVLIISTLIGITLKVLLPASLFMSVVITILVITTILGTTYFFAFDSFERKIIVEIMNKAIVRIKKFLQGINYNYKK